MVCVKFIPFILPLHQVRGAISFIRLIQVRMYSTGSGMNQSSFLVADMKGTLSKKGLSAKRDSLPWLGSHTTHLTFSKQVRPLMQKYWLKSLPGARTFPCPL